MFKLLSNRKKLIVSTGLGLCLLMIPPGKAQSPFSNQPSQAAGPISMEPTIEKNGVRVSLRSNIQKKNQMRVLIKVSNFSGQPILVSPDAIETTTEEGFVIRPSNGILVDSSESHWSKFSKAASLIPFADPYQIISKTQKVADFAKKSGLWDHLQNGQKKTLQLKEVILQPGMATHGLIIYDASSLNAFSYNPMLRIKVNVGSEPFEFIFDSTPLKQGSSR